LRLFLNLPKELREKCNNYTLEVYESVNLYFQDESRFGLMTHASKSLTARGVKPIVKYKHAFKNTFLYGAFSPVDGDSFVYEKEGTSSFSYLFSFIWHKFTQIQSQ
jgi:hypothetical protein